MALRIRKDGTILCAAMHPELPDDVYIPDGLHYQMSVIEKVICTEPFDKHVLRGEWWWKNNIPEGIEIWDWYFEENTNTGRWEWVEKEDFYYK